MSEFRKRVLIPFLLPIGGLVAAAIVVFSFSRVLLAVPKYWSVSLALLLAAEVLGVGAIIAAVRRVSKAQAVLITVLGIAVLAGGGYGFAKGIRPIEAHAAPVEIAAEGLAFDADLLEVPSDVEFDLVFTNQDAGIPHNVAIAEQEGASAFSGEIFNGVATRVYVVPALAAGDYLFRCDVHPQMTGSLVAGEGAGHGAEPVAEPSGEPSEHDAITVRAVPVLKFDTTEIRVVADTEVHIVFENQDTGIPHNIAVYPDDTFASPAIFAGEIITGPDSASYTFDGPPAGSYAFKCDVHSNMMGTFVAE